MLGFCPENRYVKWRICGMLVSSLLFMLCLSFCFSAVSSAASPKSGTGSAPIFITIATGPLNGRYYETGRRLCGIINSADLAPRLLCTVERTAGSIYNLKAVASGEAEFCLTQEDHLNDALSGTPPFTLPLDMLQGVEPLFQESLVVVVRKESVFRRLRDLKGRRVSTGLKASGGHGSFMMLTEFLGWSQRELQETTNISNRRALAKLCNNELDAVVFMAGHPYAPLTEAAERCDLRFLRVRGGKIHKFLMQNPAYIHTEIPAGIYRGVNRPVKTIGVASFLVTSSAVPVAVVKAVARAAENLPE